ncbi:MAG: hypothetical protein GTO14_06335 [Anaerolineales bacterium]|nr:hypothetical protein [Anaerolineales bacterium]
MEDFYPMPMFVNLDVSDPSLSAGWYQRALGFRELFRSGGDEPELIHLRRDRCQDLFLLRAEGGSKKSPAEGITIQFQAGAKGVAEIAAQAKIAGSSSVEGPVERPWNVRDVTIRDPDGYRLRFSEPIDVSKSFEEVMGDGD